MFFDLAVRETPFGGSVRTSSTEQGLTIADVVHECEDIPISMYLHIRVTISYRGKSSEVPLSLWRHTRPKEGTHVLITPFAEGPLLATLLTTVITAAAPTLAGSLFGLAAGTFAFSLAVAGISIVGSLLVSALIPPPSQGGARAQDDPVFNITSQSNTASPYEPYPTVIGRHIMFPKRTTTGFTETVRDEIYLRQRMTFGHGPVSLETLKIGDTNITEFEGVELEFLNVDKDRTLANMPELEALVKPKTFETVDKPYVMNEGGEYIFSSNQPGRIATATIDPAGSFGVSSSEVTFYERVEGTTPWVLISVNDISSVTTLASPEYTAGGEVREYRLEVTGVTPFPGLTIPATQVITVTETLVKYQDGFFTGGWRYGTEKMTLYPADVSEAPYNVLLEYDQPVVRGTTNDVISAQVDVSFQGLVRYDDKGRRTPTPTVTLSVEWRRLGDTAWTSHDDLVCDETTTTYIRFTSEIDFPSSGEYEIQVTRLTHDTDVDTIIDKATLSAIRSVQAGDLPSHEGISEIALRIKGTSQLNGQIDSLNAVVQQLGETWDGTALKGWVDERKPIPDGYDLTLLEPIRHPAWCYLNALIRTQLSRPVPITRIDVQTLYDWAVEEPHWTCDMVIEGKQRLADVLDLICATGRVRRGMNDLKYSVIRDGGAGGVVQHFTPHNSWGFKGRKKINRTIHGLKMKVVSERRNWGVDEVIVYNDGFGPVNATDLEPMSLPGIVVTQNDIKQNNVYRLGRYFLAVAELRPEEFSFSSELDHLVCQMGDKIRVAHDVPLFGVGSARVVSVATDGISFVLSETLLTDVGFEYRVRFRTALNDEVALKVVHISEGTWAIENSEIAKFADPLDILADVAYDDLAIIEVVGIDEVDLLITSIDHMDELKATITAVPAAPAVLTAADGEIPDYNPQINKEVSFTPAPPVPNNIRSGVDAANIETDLSLSPRIGVAIDTATGVNLFTQSVRLRWRRVGSTRWTVGELMAYRTEVFTGSLENGADYEVQIESVYSNGQSSGWVAAGTTSANTTDLAIDAPVWETISGVDTVTLYGPVLVKLNFAGYNVYAATDASDVLTFIGNTSVPNFIYRPDAADGYTRYKVAGYDHNGDEGAYSDFMSVIPTGVTIFDLAADVIQELADLEVDYDATQAAAAIAQAAAVAAQTSETQSSVHATNAASSADDAEQEAVAATTQASISTTQAGMAGVFAAEAQTAELVTAEIARSSLPFNFTQDGRFWHSSYDGDPATVLDLSGTAYVFTTTANDGRVLRTTSDGATNMGVSPKGAMFIIPGRTYRATARVRIFDFNGGTARTDLQLRTLDGTYVSTAVTGTDFHAHDTLYEWVDLVVEYTAPADLGSDVYLRPFVYHPPGSTSTGAVIDTKSIIFEDVTSVITSGNNASASAASASEALASETQTGQDAAAVTADRVAAETASGEAAAQAVLSAGSATSAAGSSNEAQIAQSITARSLSSGAASNPQFTQWAGAQPDGFVINTLGGSFSKETVAVKYANAVVLTTAASPIQAGPQLYLRAVETSGNTRVSPDDADVILVKAEIELVSGASWANTYFRVIWSGSTSGVTFHYISDMGLSSEIGLIQKVEFFAERPAGFIQGGNDRTQVDFYATQASGVVKTIAVHSMDFQAAGPNTQAGIIQRVNATTEGQQEAFIGIGVTTVGAYAQMSFFAGMDPDGVPISNISINADQVTLIGGMGVFIDGILASTNYAETGGVPTAGFQLDGPNGTIKAVSVIDTLAVVPGAIYRNFFDTGSETITMLDPEKIVVTVSDIELQPKRIVSSVVKNPVIFTIQVTGYCDATAGLPPSEVAGDLVLKLYDDTPTLLATFDQVEIGQSLAKLKTRGASSPATPASVTVVLDDTFGDGFDDIDSVTLSVIDADGMGVNHLAVFDAIVRIEQINR